MLDRFQLTRLKGLRNFVKGDARPDPGATATSRVVCVASGKGGTGKSIMASNLSVLRARRGERVLLVDFDAGLANAHLLLGLAPKHDLGHVMQGSIDPHDAIVEGPPRPEHALRRGWVVRPW